MIVEVPEVMTIAKASRRMRIAPARLRKAIKDGTLEAYHLGGRCLYVTDEGLAKWVESTRVPKYDWES